MAPRWNDSNDNSEHDKWDSGSDAWGNSPNIGSAWDLNAETPTGYNPDYQPPIYGEYRTGNFGGDNARRRVSPIPLRPLDVKDTVNATIQLIRSNFVTLWTFPFLLSLLSVGISVALGLIEGNTTAWTTILLEGQDASISVYFVLNQVLSLVLSVLISVIVTNALLAAVYGRKVSPGQALHMSRGDIGRLLVATLVYSAFLALVMFVAFYILLQAIGVPNIGAPGTFLLGFLAVFVVTIYLMIRFTCVVPALIAEDLGPVRAVVRSWQLTAGKAGHIFGAMLYLALAAFLVSLFIVGPLSMALAPMTTGPGSLTATVIVTAVLAGIQSSAILPISLALSTVIYVNMRFYKEGFHEQVEAEL